MRNGRVAEASWARHGHAPRARVCCWFVTRRWFVTRAQGQHLEMFFCDNNRIRALPETIGYLPSIKVLFVEYNVRAPRFAIAGSLPGLLMR